MVGVRRIEEPRFNIKEREKTGGKHWRGTPTNDSMWPMRSYFSYFVMRLIYARKLILEGQKFRFLVWFPHDA